LIVYTTAGQLVTGTTEQPTDEAAMSRHAFIALEAIAGTGTTGAKYRVLVNTGF